MAELKITVGQRLLTVVTGFVTAENFIKQSQNRQNLDVTTTLTYFNSFTTFSKESLPYLCQIANQIDDKNIAQTTRNIEMNCNNQQRRNHFFNFLDC